MVYRPVLHRRLSSSWRPHGAKSAPSQNAAVSIPWRISATSSAMLQQKTRPAAEERPDGACAWSVANSRRWNARSRPVAGKWTSRKAPRFSREDLREWHGLDRVGLATGGHAQGDLGLVDCPGDR